MIIFVADDKGYLTWLSDNPDGYVVNTYRTPDPHYLVLHRSSCRHIRGTPPHGTAWTDSYAKICSRNTSELESWASRELGRSSLPKCRTCKPHGDTTPVWPLEPGARLARKDLHELISTTYGGGGGQRQGGISTPKQAPEILFFTDPATGTQHGYIDEWREDGHFHYTGEGQRGDQRMQGGNRAIAEHRKTGRRLRKFNGSSGVVEYSGEFTLADEEPWYETDAPESGGKELRKVIVFRVRPLDHEPPTHPAASAESHGTATSVSVEAQHTETYVQVTEAASRTVERIEQSLVLSYRDVLAAKGHQVARRKYQPDEYAKPLFSDLFDETSNTLIEAKGSVARHAIRMAIGQLADYHRFEDPDVSLAVLLPERPRAELEDLLLGMSITLIYQEGSHFQQISPDS